MSTKDFEEIVEDESIDWVEEQLEAWLKKRDWQVEELVGLLEGHEIPFVVLADEPYLALLEALPDGGERFTAETELALRAAVLLDRRPDEIPVGELPQRLLYNLLLLCAGLACSDQLADPLHAMWKRRSLKGEWQGLDLRYALSAALASNQLDSRMASEWWAMLGSRPTEFLPGSGYDGFEAILWMPESAKRRGEPFLKAIGSALKIMAGSLEESKNRRLEFRALIRKVKETYPNRRSWDEDLIYLADRHSFPGWAVESLPKLFHIRKEFRDGTRLVLLWNILATCMKNLDQGWVQQQSLCGGRVVEAKISAELFPGIQDIALRIDERRKTFPLPSEKGLHGAISDLLAKVDEVEKIAEPLQPLLEGRQKVIDELLAA